MRSSLWREWLGQLRARPPRHLGLLGALSSLWIALSPSLLPRQWWMHLINVVLCLLVGYWLGLAAGYVWRSVSRVLGLEITVAPRVRPWLRRAYWLTLTVVTVVVWWKNLYEQDYVARLVGVHPHAGLHATFGLVLGLSLFAAGFASTRLWTVLVERLEHFGSGILHLSRTTARVVAWVLVIALAVIIPNNWLATTALNQAVGAMAQLNTRTLPGRVAPTQPEKSGSPSSRETWASLGAQGQGIVADGPHAADISAYSGRSAKEPIRVYAGLPSGRSLEDAADRVVAELDRTHAWERKNLLVATSTGTGWIEEFELSPFEYLTDGDSAIASMQYSYLGSPLAFVLDSTAARRAGTLLFDKIYARWAQLPVTHRPKLYATGYSMGSTGGQAAFSSVDDMLNRVDGALWIGTPSTTPLWQQLTAARQPGSPEIAPVVNNGVHIRFATRPADLSQTYFGGEYAPWSSPRIVYAQHASDPIVWWNPELIYAEPAWARERVGRDVNPSLTWHPWATFWQLAGDMAVSGDVPQPHGHRYQEELVPEWAAVLGYDPRNDYTHLQHVLRDRWLAR